MNKIIVLVCLFVLLTPSIAGGQSLSVNAGTNSELDLNPTSTGPVVIGNLHKSTFNSSGNLNVSGIVTTPGVVVGTTTDDASLAQFSTNTFGNTAPFLSYNNMFDAAGWQLHLVSEDANGFPVMATEGYGNGGGVSFNFAEGDISNPSEPLDGDGFGFVSGRGWASGSFHSGNAIVIFTADGDWSSSNHGEFFDFYATSAGATSRQEIMTIKGDGLALIGNSQLTVASTATVSGQLHIGFVPGGTSSVCMAATSCTATCPADTYVTGGSCGLGAGVGMGGTTSTATTYTCSALSSTTITATVFCGRFSN
ncbi:MAG TPA: hypothetical protein VN915_05080 [Elusimicrobiota bacterium]|nr:hypothetical protein [Elusimicrobiota bacterium]